MSDEAKNSIRARLDELYRRLDALPRAESAEAAFRQLCDTLEAVEDELSGVKRRPAPPPPSVSDGRMYCPLDDHITRRADGSIFAMTRGHRIEVDGGGHLRIINKATKELEYEK